ncbi:hypothetical protein TNCV_447511 [Trichonephila clavipes]|nr:hypothetical protein TNCV_447511 [Trichonephila clavipes]
MEEIRAISGAREPSTAALMAPLMTIAKKDPQIFQITILSHFVLWSLAVLFYAVLSIQIENKKEADLAVIGINIQSNLTVDMASLAVLLKE